MKKSTILLSIILLFICFALQSPVQAQTTTFTMDQNHSAGMYYYDTIALDSAGTGWSNDFSTATSDGFSYSTYPWQYSYKAATADSVNITLYWYQTNVHNPANADWYIVDTLFTATSTSAGSGTADLNNKKAVHNKIKAVSNAGGKANTAFKFGLLQPVTEN